LLRRPLLVIPTILALAATLATVTVVTGAAADPGDRHSNEPVTTNPGAGPTSITGPIASTAAPGDASHNYVFYATPFDLKRVGYVEQEFFISGTATRYPSNPTVEQQGAVATAIGTTPYTTRIVVRRPENGRRSAGIAVVDWQNVTAGHDIDTEWGTSGDYFVRNGWTWIGASVQRVGVNGATTGATANLGLKQWNPTRYASLDLTNGGTVLDDTQSFDVYTQIGQLAKGTSRDNPLADLRLNKVYAAGASQSARFLGIYYNTVQPIAPVFDGFLFAIGGSSLPPRAAVGTKAMRVFTENDVLRGALVPSQQMPDSDVLRTWAIAGASHVPGYATNPDPENFRSTLGGIQAREYGPGSPRECTNPGPSQVESWAVFHAAYEALDDWVRKGVAPRRAQPLAIANAGPPTTVVRDANGLVLGGIRLPDVEVPFALNDGINSPANLTNPLNAFCVLYGTNRAFTQDQLNALYLSNHDYREQVEDVVRRLITQKFMLPIDGLQFIDAARHRDVV
jgi:hypothetical protein